MSIFVFDAYGTLFNVHAAIARFRAEAGPEADRMSETWRAKQLEYSWTLTLAGRYVDFWALTERALDYSLTRFPSVDKALRPKLLEAYFKLDAFPDARAALRALASSISARSVSGVWSDRSRKCLGLCKTGAFIGQLLSALPIGKRSCSSNPCLRGFHPR